MSFWKFLGVLATAAALATVVVAVLSIDSIVDWFQERIGHRSTDDKLAVTVLQHMEAGNYTVMQGVFDVESEEFDSQRVVEATDIDRSFVAAHNEQGLAVWDV